MKELSPGIYMIDSRLATLNSVKGYRPFGEQLMEEGGKEYRLWDPTRSKLAAALLKGIKSQLKKGQKVLYLGAAHGYTPSYVSNIVGKEGIVYAVEFSERCFNELLPVAEKYGNIVPMLADARMPEKYPWVEKVDIVYVDIADPQQTEAAMRNCRAFLKEGGYLMLAIKARSIDVTKSPRSIVEQEIGKLKGQGFKIVDWKMLDPLERDHGFVVAKS